MRRLHIDLETYSSIDLKKSGLYKYVQASDFAILLFAYTYDEEEVKLIDVAKGEDIPPGIISDLDNPMVCKMAHNAAFEIAALSRFYKTKAEQWQCTMVHAFYCGLPGSLKEVGEAIGLSTKQQKMGIGKSLLTYFCKPCAASRANGGRIRNYPHHNEERWSLFKEYCKQDVVTEREVYSFLQEYELPLKEWQYWWLDQHINTLGAMVDLELVEGALYIWEVSQNQLLQKAKDLTGLENPNSLVQLKQWLYEQTGVDVISLNKESMKELVGTCEADSLVAQVLELKQAMGKTSVKKYNAMAQCVGADGRIRGLIQFYGANRTGRFAGRLVQIQNLPRNYSHTLDIARNLVKSKSVEGVTLIYKEVADILSQLIRTAFIPRKGCHLCVADFSAIEARVLAWLANETWRLEVFQTHGKIYEASASAMFGVPLETITKGHENYELRGKGKVAELALGYGGGAGALIAMGALHMGLDQEDLPDMVRRWRGSNRRITDFWYSVENAALDTVAFGIPIALPCGVTFHRNNHFLFITLPSGRALHYYKPKIMSNALGKRELQYYGMNGKWSVISTWGGKLVENIVQAVSRDLLCHAMETLTVAGYPIIFHVHDEVVLEIDDADTNKNLKDAIEKMCALPKWANGLPLNADGFDYARYYQKD